MLVRTWIDGVPLQIWERDASERERYRLATAFVALVQQVHDAGVAHGDLSPTNVLVADGQPVLIDFEHARLQGRAHPGATEGFAAPEHFWFGDALLLDHRADVYAVAVLLKWLLFGEAPPTREQLARRVFESREGVEAGIGLRSWLRAMSHPRRCHRPARLDGLVRTLEGAPEPYTAMSVSMPTAIARATRLMADRERAAWRHIIPAGLLVDDRPPGQWAAVAREVEKAAGLRRLAEESAVWESQFLELHNGTPWFIVDNARHYPSIAAHLAVRMGAPVLAKEILGAGEVRGDPISLVTAAHVEAKLGNAGAANRMLMAGLQMERPQRRGEVSSYWFGVVHSLYLTGRFGMLLSIVRALPRTERHRSIAASIVPVERLLYLVNRQLGRSLDVPVIVRRIPAIALRSAQRELSTCLGWMCCVLLRSGTADDVIQSCLQAVQTTAQQMDDGQLLRLVTEVSRGLETLSPNGIRATAVAALRELESAKDPREDVLPAWALDDDNVVIEDGVSEVSPRSQTLGAVVQSALALVSAGRVEGGLRFVEDALKVQPRNGVLWSTALQLCALITADNPGSIRQSLGVVCDALEAAGMPAACLGPWRMQAERLGGHPERAIQLLGQTKVHRPLMRAEWAVAALCWDDLGRGDFRAQALEQMRRRE